MFSRLLPVLLVYTASAASPCCMDRQFEARMGEMGDLLYQDKSTPINTENVMHYDYYNKMIAVEATVHQGNTTSTSDVLINLATSDMYVTTGGHCQKMKNPYPPPFIEPCIPANAKVIGSSYIGYGVNAVPFTTWQFFVKEINEVVRLSVTDEGCIPLVEGVFGTTGRAKSEIVFILTNFKPGVRKPSIFNIPPNCPEVKQTTNLPADINKLARAARKLTSFR